MERQARCFHYGGKAKHPVEPDGTCKSQATIGSMPLPFFETRAEGSEWATEYCECGMGRWAHENPLPGVQPSHAFVARGPAEFDAYYCGCWGWD